MGRPARLPVRESPGKARRSSRSSTRSNSIARNTTTKKARPSRLSRSAAVADTDEDDDCIKLSSDKPSDNNSDTGRMSFKGVYIPVKQPVKETPVAATKKRVMRASVPSSRSSLESSNNVFTRDNSEVDTANTSIVSTPAPEVSRSSTRKLFPKNHVFENPATASSSSGRGKRKRGANNTADDEALALALQEQEYEETASKLPKLLPKSRRTAAISLVDDPSSVEESSSEDSTLSDIDSLDDIPLARSFGKNKKKKQRKPTIATKKSLTKTKLPKRKARLSAMQSIKARASSDIDDFDSDESELTYIAGDSDDEFSDVPRFKGISDDDASGMEEPDDSELEEITNRFTQIPGESFEAFRARTKRKQAEWEPRAVRERRRLEKSHPEILTMWSDLKAMPKIEMEEAEQPTSISRKLKPFQLEGLNWMRKQEQTRWKGGLLGDEMGMGKTIQAVSLIMSDYPVRPHQPTLVVVPPVALMQWTNEIQDYTSGQLKVLVYHGTNSKAKKMKVSELKSYDVIMISYSGLESIYRKETKGWKRDDNIIKEDSAMHAIHFHRIILDEAHSIKSRTAGVAKACFALKGTYKWCLSGTPVQNRIGEFFSLLRFLNAIPFTYYFCKGCPCSTMDWKTDGDYKCIHCNHRTLDHVSVFNQEILNPVVSGETDEERKEGLAKLRLLTDHIMLRRMKRDHTSSMELPPKEIVIHNEFFGEIERDFSASIMTNTARQFDTYVSRGVMLNNYANIFGLIMQMRQVSDHPDLLLKRHAEAGQNVLVCNICDEPAEDAIRSRCRHEFCRVCVKDYMRTCEASGADPDCPRCHIALAIDLDQPEIEQNEEAVKKSSIINRIKMENWHSSTKIEMLVYDLYKLRSRKQTLKSIVFSQFTSMLQLIEWRLRRAGFNTVMLDGSMSPAQRQKSIEYFMNNTDVEVFLVSLKAGGVALNLTEASRVFIVDPWWNPAAEWQSADRCHRIGQRRPCVITRLCIEDSVESRIVMLQEKKANLINGTVNNDEVAMDKLSPEDMQFLFRGS